MFSLSSNIVMAYILHKNDTKLTDCEASSKAISHIQSSSIYGDLAKSCSLTDSVSDHIEETQLTASDTTNPIEPSTRTLPEISLERRLLMNDPNYWTIVEDIDYHYEYCVCINCCNLFNRNIQIMAGLEFEAALIATSNVSKQMETMDPTYYCALINQSLITPWHDVANPNANPIANANANADEATYIAIQQAIVLDKMLRLAKTDFDKSGYELPLRLVLDSLCLLEQAANELEITMGKVSILNKFKTDAHIACTKIELVTDAVDNILHAIEFEDNLTSVANYMLDPQHNFKPALPHCAAPGCMPYPYGTWGRPQASEATP
jgi:hypothetical protein